MHAQVEKLETPIRENESISFEHILQKLIPISRLNPISFGVIFQWSIIEEFGLGDLVKVISDKTS